MIDVASARVFLAALAGWFSGRQQEAVAYLIEENRILRRQLGRQRLRLTDADGVGSPREGTGWDAVP